ncbi:MAG: M14 family zinc carboxypeptidase [Thermoplasmata archaeon]
MRKLVSLGIVLLFLALPPSESCSGEGRDEGLGRYHTYQEMVTELQDLTATHTTISRLITIGETYEGRRIWAVKISDNASEDEAEPNMTIIGGIHAREFISVEVPLYIIHNLLGNYTSNSTIKRFVDSTQIWVVPMLNPDGHVYVELGHDWRKNRRPVDGGVGVDLNRNFGHLWGLEASHNPTDENYCGPGPFSENETKAIEGLVTSHRPRVALSYQSFGGYILYPWGNSINTEPVDPLLPALALNMSLVMPEGRRYTPMMAREMYPATGDTDDYFYANFSILPFTVELSNSHRPPDQEVDGICLDNLPPAHLLMNFTAGPAPEPPLHRISLDGPNSFISAPGRLVRMEYLLVNEGEATEEVELSIETEFNWTAELLNRHVSLEPGQSALIFLEIMVPATAAAYESASFLLRAKSAGGVVAELRILGRAEHLRGLRASLSGQTEAAPGGSVNISATVENLGNGPELLALSAGLSTGWQISPLPNPLNLSAGERAVVFITFLVPASARADTPVELIFTARAEGVAPARAIHTISILPVRNVTMEILPSSARFPEGETRNVSIRIANNGNVWENGTLVLSGRYGASRIQNASVNIPPFSTINATLTLGAARGHWSLTVMFLSASGELRASRIVNFTVIENTTVAGAGPPGDPVLLFAVLVIVLVSVMGIIYWDWRREERLELEERERRPRNR